jgi:hypothetical protein
LQIQKNFMLLALAMLLFPSMLLALVMLLLL